MTANMIAGIALFALIVLALLGLRIHALYVIHRRYPGLRLPELLRELHGTADGSRTVSARDSETTDERYRVAYFNSLQRNGVRVLGDKRSGRVYAIDRRGRRYRFDPSAGAWLTL